MIGLGLDTGGTYTDGAIYHFDDQKILMTAKSVTIKEDLTIGINQVLDQLDPGLLDKVELVSLSTTLATNACVEGKGGRARLILIGCDRRILQRYGHESGLPDAEQIIFVSGGHDQAGQAATAPDWEDLRMSVAGQDAATDAYAVVELWGIRNSAFEQQARDLLREWTGKPVVCGYEITGELNSLRRAASALLNARLLPLINDFLDAVRTSLDQRHIRAPLVIVRSDGSLMAEDFARARPVETLLCGPAASAAGGLALTGERDCIIVDMGGTTSDIALIRQGEPVMADHGAQIGAWRTGIRSILIQTVGLGGDSLIRHNQENSLSIGPRRAAPLCWAAQRWPRVKQVLQQLLAEERKHTYSLAEFFYRLIDGPVPDYCNERETVILNALAEGPLSLVELADRTGISIYGLKTERLEQQELVMRCGLTPTDIMHLTGEYDIWDKEAARTGADIMAFQLDMDRRSLIDRVRSQMKESLYTAIIQMLLEHEYREALGPAGPGTALTGLCRDQFSRYLNGQQERHFLNPDFQIHVPLVGIGAPIHLYLPPIAAFAKTACVIPAHAGVANAVGAITGHITATAVVLIKPRYSPAGITGYYAYAAQENHLFKTHEEAVVWAREAAWQEARLIALRRGSSDPDMTVAVDRREAPMATIITGDDADDASDSDSRTVNQQEPSAASGLADNQAVPEADGHLPDSGTPGLLHLETLVEARAIGKVALIHKSLA